MSCFSSLIGTSPSRRDGGDACCAGAWCIPPSIAASRVAVRPGSAIDSLLKSRRQALHRRAAEVLRDDPDCAAAAPEVVAHHFTEARLDDLAIEWWGKAGD